MSYKTYTTEAIVCGSRLNNTSDKAFLLFTRDAGMIWATARSVREERSKQRYALQDFALVRASLVKGKTGWKVGSIECVKNYFTEASDSKQKRISVAAIIKLIRQFVHGEVGYPDIFDDTKSSLATILSSSDIKDDQIENIFSLRLLHKLGYIAESNGIEQYLFSENCWSLPILSTDILKYIDRAKQVSHL